MTENKIKEFVQSLRNRVETFVNSGWAIDGLINDYTKSADTIEKLFEEIQQYRAIGTVRQVQDFIEDWRKFRELGNLEELKALKEKNEPKKVKGIRFIEAVCPKCESELFETYWAFGGIHYCSNCGQAIDWQ